MSNIEDMNGKAVKSYLGFEEGTYAARKGRLCFIKKIHFEMHPPSVTVQMMDTDTEVGTEFDRLQHLKSWFCDICTAENKEVQAKKCFFCKMDRSFKEKVTVIAPSDSNVNGNANSLQPVPEHQLVEEAPVSKDVAVEETSDEVSEESKVTDDEYEELPDHEPAKHSDGDHELSTEDEPEHEPVAHDPMYGRFKQSAAGHWPSYQREAAMQGQPSRRRAASAKGYGDKATTSSTTQNRKRPHTDFLPPPPMGHRPRAAPNRRARSQPGGFWMDDDEDMMPFRRPMSSYWPRSWYDWDW